MPTVYVVGGLGESELWTATGFSRQIWINPTVIMLGGIGAMRLAPNGSDPGPPEGEALAPRGVPAPYIGLPAAQLALQLVTRGLDVVTFAWDWRKSVYAAGVDLAAAIRRSSTAEEPCAVVGHSAGGLVARAAWTELGTTDEHALIRRIVTLGTPHWGSYSLVGFFQGDNRSIDICEYWNGTVGYNTAGYAPAATGYQLLSNLFYRKLGISWPGLYDCLPVLGAPGAEDDPLRSLVYDAASWPADARPQQVWLDYARDHTGPWLRSAASQPPADVLTCASGRGETSAGWIRSAAAFADGGGLGGELPGDGTVAQVDSELAGATIHRYVCDHASWLPALVGNGELVTLLEEINPVPPPPTPASSPQIIMPQVRQLPGAELPDFSGGARPVCTPGQCSC